MNVRFFLGVMAFAFAGGWGMGYAAEKTYPCFRMERAPEIDGCVENEPIWKSLPAADGFVKTARESGTLSARPTKFKMGWTDRDLFVAMICDEPCPGDIRAGRKDGTPLWYEDSVEIFLFPRGADEYCQHIINAVGRRSANRGGKSVSLDVWEAIARVGKNAWELECKIPFSTLMSNPHDRETWTGNICRNTMSVFPYEFSSWAPLKESAHAPEQFARIQFFDRPPGAKEVGFIEKEMKSLFRKRMALIYFDLIKKQNELFDLENGRWNAAGRSDAAAWIFEGHEGTKKEAGKLDSLSCETMDMVYNLRVPNSGLLLQ
ncbi:MAG: carbohydrate-binding family 9-like protein [Verrucomicrobiae bacterium]|nr:carbohydrate-binding family 9-like protein [Verrucomicrobiae bacterium]